MSREPEFPPALRERIERMLAANLAATQGIIEANAANLLAIVAANGENLLGLLAPQIAALAARLDGLEAGMAARGRGDPGREQIEPMLAANLAATQGIIEANAANLLATVAANGENLLGLLTPQIAALSARLDGLEAGGADEPHGAGLRSRLRDALGVEAALAAKTSALTGMIEANAKNLLDTISANAENMLGIVSRELATLSARLDASEQALLEHVVRQRGLMPLDLADLGRERPAVIGHVPLAAQFKLLEQAAPLNLAAYRACLDEGTRSYEGLPATSCSTEGHPQSLLFRAFLRPYLRGHVLDIGCGPQPVPSYLAHFPPERIVGIDPISRAEDHPFLFVSGLGEFLPFADASFDVVISATTLDHYYLLDRGLREAARVLRPGGHFVAWITEFAGAPPYDPYAGAVQPHDSEHMYHIDRAWFLPMAAREGLEAAEVFHFRQPFHYLFMSLLRRG